MVTEAADRGFLVLGRSESAAGLLDDRVVIGPAMGGGRGIFEVVPEVAAEGAVGFLMEAVEATYSSQVMPSGTVGME